MMDPKGAQAVLDVFSQSVPEIAKANIDLSKTYTNRFVEAANKGIEGRRMNSFHQSINDQIFDFNATLLYEGKSAIA